MVIIISIENATGIILAHPSGNEIYSWKLAVWIDDILLVMNIYMITSIAYPDYWSIRETIDLPLSELSS